MLCLYLTKYEISVLTEQYLLTEKNKNKSCNHILCNVQIFISVVEVELGCNVVSRFCIKWMKTHHGFSNVQHKLLNPEKKK